MLPQRLSCARVGDYIALTGGQLWAEIERSRMRFRPFRISHFDASVSLSVQSCLNFHATRLETGDCVRTLIVRLFEVNARSIAIND